MVANSEINQEIANGGNYYTYVEKLKAPESEKARLTHAYEEAYISEMIQFEEYLGDKGRAEKASLIEKKIMLIEQFKKDHPDYPELAM